VQLLHLRPKPSLLNPPPPDRTSALVLFLINPRRSVFPCGLPSSCKYTDALPWNLRSPPLPPPFDDLSRTHIVQEAGDHLLSILSFPFPPLGGVSDHELPPCRGNIQSFSELERLFECGPYAILVVFFRFDCEVPRLCTPKRTVWSSWYYNLFLTRAFLSVQKDLGACFRCAEGWCMD